VIVMTNDTVEGRRPDALGPQGDGASTLVVGLDGSPSSWDAFSWAAWVAAHENGRVVAVYVMPWPDPAAAFGAPYDYDGVELARREIAQELTDEAARRAGDLGVPVSFVGARGDVSRALADVARTVHAELVVVGKSAKWLHHLGGSLSHRLTCRNDAPVVVVVP
jgi:nucleotide-binding universal stress UspA family protein